MKKTFLILMVLAAGCTHNHKHEDDCCASKEQRPPIAAAPVDVPAVALAFNLPSALSSNDRDSRAPRAFAGYQSQVTEFFWLHTDDRVRFAQIPWGHHGGGVLGLDRYERRAVSTRVGVLYR